MHIYLLWHVHDLDGEKDGKLVGVYSSEALAKQAEERAKMLPGFQDAKDGFIIHRYQVDSDLWPEGYVTFGD